MKISLADNRMKPGSCCICPRCGAVGRYESTYTAERHRRFNDFVRYDDLKGEFECHACQYE